MARKVIVYRHSQETDGQRTHTEEVEIIDSRTERGVTTYIVRTQDGIECSAIYNIFTGVFYADEVFGGVERVAGESGCDKYKGIKEQ